MPAQENPGEKASYHGMKTLRKDCSHNLTLTGPQDFFSAEVIGVHVVLSRDLRFL